MEILSQEIQQWVHGQRDDNMELGNQASLRISKNKQIISQCIVL